LTESDTAGHLEREFVGIHVVVAAVVESDLKIHHGISGEIAARRGFDDPLFDSGNEVLGNGASEDIVDELKLLAALERLHLDLAVAVLAMAAGLLLVASLYVGSSADSFPIRHLWRLQVHFRVITALELGNQDFNMLLPGAGNEKFFGLRIAVEPDHGIFF